MKTKIFLILLALFGITYTSYAQNNTDLFDYVNNNTQTTFDKVGEKYKVIKINENLLNKPEDIHFVLPDGKDCFVKNSTNYINENNYNAWAGRIIKDNKIIGFAYFVEKSGKTIGKIYTQEQSYMILPEDSTLHYIQELNTVKNEGNDCFTSFFEEEMYEDYYEQKDSISIVTNEKISKFDFPFENTSKRTLRIAFLYTPEALNYFNVGSGWEHNGTTIIDHINFYVEELNFVFAFSQLDLKAVFSFASLTENENPDYSMEDEFKAFRNSSDGRYDEIFDIDPMLNADVSVLLIRKGSGISGPYWLLGWDKFVVDIENLKDLTLPHELGHVLGCEHNIEEFSVWGRLTANKFKSYGYANTFGGYRSIMSYAVDGYTTTRMPFYSTPELNFANGARGAKIYDNTWGMETATNCWGAVMGNSTNLIKRRADYDENDISLTVKSGTFSNHYDLYDVVASDYICENGSEVLMHGRRSVKLKPGFIAQTGSNFHAYISDYDSPPSFPQVSLPPNTPDVKYFHGGINNNYPYQLCPCESLSSWLDQALYFVIDEFDGITTNYTWELNPKNSGLMTWGGFEEDNFVCGISKNYAEDMVSGIYTLTVYGYNAYGERSNPYIVQFEILDGSNTLCESYCDETKQQKSASDKQNSVAEKPLISQNKDKTNLDFVDDSFEDQYLIFPNPSNGIFNIQTSYKNSETSIEIVNILGEIVYSEKFYTNTYIDLSHKPKGLYMVRLQTENKLHTTKIVFK